MKALVLSILMVVGTLATPPAINAQQNPGDYPIAKLIKQKKYKEAFAMAQQKAQQGDAIAQFHLGALYEYGAGTEKSYLDAGRWYQKSAKQGYLEAMVSLGLVLVRFAPGAFEKNTPQWKRWKEVGNKSTGRDWINKAAHGGNFRAMVLKCTFGSDTMAPAELKVKGLAWCRVAKILAADDKDAQQGLTDLEQKTLQNLDKKAEQAANVLQQELIEKFKKKGIIQ